MQIQTHISKYKCLADSCVPFHMPHIGRILNMMSKINFLLLGNQVTKLLISTMIHLELFPNTASIYTAFPLKLLVQNENQMSSTPTVLPAQSALPSLTHHSHSLFHLQILQNLCNVLTLLSEVSKIPL